MKANTLSTKASSRSRVNLENSAWSPHTSTNYCPLPEAGFRSMNLLQAVSTTSLTYIHTAHYLERCIVLWLQHILYDPLIDHVFHILPMVVLFFAQGPSRVQDDATDVIQYSAFSHSSYDDNSLAVPKLSFFFNCGSNSTPRSECSALAVVEFSFSDLLLLPEIRKLYFLFDISFFAKSSGERILCHPRLSW